MTPEQMEIFKTNFPVDIEMQSIITQLMHINTKVDEGVVLQENRLRTLESYVKQLRVKQERAAIDEEMFSGYPELYNVLKSHLNTNLADQFRVAIQGSVSFAFNAHLLDYVIGHIETLLKVDNLVMSAVSHPARWLLESRSDPYSGVMTVNENIILTYPEYMKREPVSFANLDEAVVYWIKAMYAPVIYGQGD